MKAISKYILFLAIFLNFVSITNAQQTYVYSSQTINDGGVYVINMTDRNIRINGTITITNGTLIIYSNATSDRYIRSAQTSGTIASGKSLFTVAGTGKLLFNYNNNTDTIYEGRIIIDGGADFSEMNRSEDMWSLEPGTDLIWNASAIESTGMLEMHNVTFRNFNLGSNHNPERGLIGLATRTFMNKLNPDYLHTYAHTLLKNCTVEKCQGSKGTFLMISDGKNDDGKFLLGTGDRINPEVSDSYGQKRYITLENVLVQDCISFADDSGWGGLIRCRGASPYSLRLVNSTFTGNFAKGDGGVLWWNAYGHQNTKCYIEGCTFTNNRAMRDAGALRLEASFEFTGATTTVSGNECLGIDHFRKDTTRIYGIGGGIQIAGYEGGSSLPFGENITYKLPTCLNVTGNRAARHGGGIAFDYSNKVTFEKSTTFNANIDGVIVSGNSAAENGGGVYFSNNSPAEKDHTFNIYLNSGSIENNNSENGAGIYAKSMNIDSQAGSLITINNNTADGGCGGGIYLDNASITLSTVNVTNNKAWKGDDDVIYGGGGLFINGGTFTIESGEISNNKTDHYGGGVLAYNDLTDRQTVTLTNGAIKTNESCYGGGIAVCGAIDMSINNTTIETNKAENGGGIFAIAVDNGAAAKSVDVNYNSGIIRYNSANKVDTTPLSTVFDMDHTEYSGVGGGIYMGEFSHLTIGSPADFGLYSNTADIAADDIFGFNRNVYIELPDVQNLNLSGYTGAKTHKLYWAEDYLTNDTNYDKGTKIKGAAWNNDRTNQRYRDVAGNDSNGRKYLIDFEGEDVIDYEIDANGNSTYLALTIGWDVSTLTIVKNGMKDGENAIFTLYKANGNNGYTEYMTVILTVGDKLPDGSRSKNITLDSEGTWKVVELPWSWAYTPDVSEIKKDIPVSATEAQKTFVFTNVPKDDTPEHGESVKVNKMN